MSRSFRKQPFQAVCGNGSAKHDKMLAHKGERRALSLALHKACIYQDFEDFTSPHKYECAWNETYSWGRDGSQRYCGLTNRDWDRYIKATSDPDDLWFNDPHFKAWPPDWYLRMMRK